MKVAQTNTVSSLPSFLRKKADSITYLLSFSKESRHRKLAEWACRNYESSTNQYSKFFAKLSAKESGGFQGEALTE